MPARGPHERVACCQSCPVPPTPPSPARAQLDVEVAGAGGEWEAGERGRRRDRAAVQAVFLRDPARARDAIRLAVSLQHRRAATAPAQAAPMVRHAPRAAPAASLADRLAALQALVQRGMLTEGEAAEARAAVLAAPANPVPRLADTADLAASGLISSEELAAVKARWLAALQ